jgi:hypothetical protein
MVSLKNIEKNKSGISADYEPEALGIIGHIELDLEGKVVKSEPSEYEEEYPSHFHHAVRELEKLMLNDNPPKNKLIMWY